MTINREDGTVTLRVQALRDALSRARRDGFGDGYECGQIDLAATLAIRPTMFAFESAPQ